MKCLVHRRLPDDRFFVRRPPLHPEHIHAEQASRLRSVWIDSSKWNAHSSVPYLFLAVDSCGNLKAGIPDPAIFMVCPVQVDVEVDPLSLRGNLKFFIAAYIVKVRADKNLRNVPIPELVSLGFRMWIRLEV